MVWSYGTCRGRSPYGKRALQRSERCDRSSGN